MQRDIPERERTDAHIPGLGREQVAPLGGPYTNEEWRVLLETPVQICRAIAAVSPSGPIGMAQEIAAMRNCFKHTLQAASANPIFKAIQQQLEGGETLDTLWKDAGHAFRDHWEIPHVRQTAISLCQQCVALLKKMSPQDAQTYKEFVYLTAQHVAESAKEGGILGLGGQPISDAEQTLLNEISKTLGLARA